MGWLKNWFIQHLDEITAFSMVVSYFSFAVWLCIVLRSLLPFYYVVYRLSIGEVVTNTFLLLIGVLLSVVSGENMPRGRHSKLVFLLCTILWLVSLLLLISLYYLSPVIITTFFGRNQFRENIRLLTTATPLELEEAKAAFGVFFYASLMLSEALLVVVIMCLMVKAVTRGET